MRHGSVLLLSTLVLSGTFGEAEARAGKGFRFGFGRSAQPAVATPAKSQVSTERGRGGMVILPGAGGAAAAAAAAVSPAAATAPSYVPQATPSSETVAEPARPMVATCASSMRFGEGQGFCAIN